MYKNGQAKKWISEAALQSLQNFHYQSKSTTRVLRKPTTSTAAPMDQWKMQKTGSEPFGPPFAPCEHQLTPKRRAQGPPGAGPCRGAPKGPAWPPGATGTRALARDVPRRGGCPCTAAHTPTFGGQVHNVNHRPGGFAAVWGVHRAARNPKGGPWAALAENFPAMSSKCNPF